MSEELRDLLYSIYSFWHHDLRDDAAKELTEFIQAHTNARLEEFANKIEEVYAEQNGYSIEDRMNDQKLVTAAIEEAKSRFTDKEKS